MTHSEDAIVIGRARRWLLAIGLGLVALGAARAQEPARVPDGAVITPEFAQSLYEKVRTIDAPDGCRLLRFDTARFRIAIGLRSATGTVHELEIATAPWLRRVPRRAGQWALAVPPGLEHECGQTLAAIESVLSATDAPGDSPSGSRTWAQQTLSLITGSGATVYYGLLAISLVVLALGTLVILCREARGAASPYPMIALAAVSLVALLLRLFVSPHTFLHEYYHIAETVPAYLSGEMGSPYGKTGPTLFRLAAIVFGQGDEVGVIFLTTSIVSSLAIPAVALLDLALYGSWPRALCAAALLCVLPQHLRFSGAEDLFVHAVTFGLWTLALFALYLRTGRWTDALLAALALSVAMQTRPEMVFFPAVLVALVAVQPRRWRRLVTPPAVVALLVSAVLLIPRIVEIQAVAARGDVPAAMLPGVARYLRNLVLLHPELTPALYRWLLVAGVAWGLRRRRDLLLWAALAYCGYTLFSISLFSNRPYNLRSQVLVTPFVVLIAAGAASLWEEVTARWRRRAARAGAALLVLAATMVLVGWRGFVTELRDQQLEWAFLQREVPSLPPRATLLVPREPHGMNLDAFPEFLLRGEGRKYTLVDLRRAVRGEESWPEAGDEVIYYQGMFCYFSTDGTLPVPMSRICQAVHDRYELEPLVAEELHTLGYSELTYAPPPYRIGFFRLKKAR